MSRLTDQMRSIMEEDFRSVSYRSTCRRRGTAARIVLIVDGEIEKPATLVSVNGSAHCRGVQGDCNCAHAEQRLLMMYAKGWHGWALRGEPILLSTLEPCSSCANLILVSGLVNGVAWLQSYKDSSGSAILAAAGMKLYPPNSPFSCSTV